jgi:hypothetical protein
MLESRTFLIRPGNITVTVAVTVAVTVTVACNALTLLVKPIGFGSFTDKPIGGSIPAVLATSRTGMGSSRAVPKQVLAQRDPEGEFCVF